MKRTAPQTHKPDFEPVTIDALDWILSRMRGLLTEIRGGGGLWTTKVLLIVSAAYWNSGY